MKMKREEINTNEIFDILGGGLIILIIIILLIAGARRLIYLNDIDSENLVVHQSIIKTAERLIGENHESVLSGEKKEPLLSAYHRISSGIDHLKEASIIIRVSETQDGTNGFKKVVIMPDVPHGGGVIHVEPIVLYLAPHGEELKKLRIEN
ncbi:MAG: hypothetical protein JW774_07010 [Candidatus Aureabacteria bacterium]|nr:hypothetical protein [Candidatus Auribacterota bacterium]